MNTASLNFDVSEFLAVIVGYNFILLASFIVKNL